MDGNYYGDDILVCCCANPECMKNGCLRAREQWRKKTWDTAPYPQPYVQPERTGWVCPKCQKGVSPDMLVCPFCPSIGTKITNTTG